MISHRLSETVFPRTWEVKARSGLTLPSDGRVRQALDRFFITLGNGAFMANRQTADPEVEPPGRQLSKPSIVFGLTAIALAVVGIVLLITGHSWVQAVGIALIALAGIPAVIGFGRLSYAAMAHRAARRRPIA